MEDVYVARKRGGQQMEGEVRSHRKGWCRMSVRSWREGVAVFDGICTIYEDMVLTPRPHMDRRHCTYDRVLELQVFFFSVGSCFVFFGLFGPPDRVSFFS